MVIDYCTRSEPALNARETKQTVWEGPAPAPGSSRLPAARRCRGSRRSAPLPVRSAVLRTRGWRDKPPEAVQRNGLEPGGSAPRPTTRPRSRRGPVGRMGGFVVPSPSPTAFFRPGPAPKRPVGPATVPELYSRCTGWEYLCGTDCRNRPYTYV